MNKITHCLYIPVRKEDFEHGCNFTNIFVVSFVNLILLLLYDNANCLVEALVDDTFVYISVSSYEKIYKDKIVWEVCCYVYTCMFKFLHCSTVARIVYSVGKTFQVSMFLMPNPDARLLLMTPWTPTWFTESCGGCIELQHLPLRTTGLLNSQSYTR